MVASCIVRDCRSVWHPGCDIIFHSFPSNPVECDVWLNIIELKRPFFQKAKICSLHFKPTDYMVTGNRLRQGVTPFFNKEKANSSPSQLNEEHATSTASEITLETMLAKPPCSPVRTQAIHESLPLRDATEENVNVANCKRPRSLLRDILETDKTKNIDDTITSKKVMDKSTSPIRFSCADKSLQTRMKSKREAMLMKKNRALVQKIFRLRKTINDMKSKSIVIIYV